MIDLDVIKKIRDDLVDNKKIVVSENPNIDRINLIEVLSDIIVMEEAKCKKRNKLTSD